MALITADRALADELRQAKYARLSADELSVSADLQAAREQFFGEWDDLPVDRYLKNGARFRRRRFAYFYYQPTTGDVRPFSLKTPYFQSRAINTYAGGVARAFAPLSDLSLSSRFLRELIAFDFRQLPIDSGTAAEPWALDVHQIRIVASPDEAGEPTPEGVHHDENDFVFVHLIARRNCLGGQNTVHDTAKRTIARVTLRRPLDSLILWDPHVMHGVTSIAPKDLSRSAVRDVLLIGYSHSPDLERPAAP